jgi:hypothetical protein
VSLADLGVRKPYMGLSRWWLACRLRPGMIAVLAESAAAFDQCEKVSRVI